MDPKTMTTQAAPTPASSTTRKAFTLALKATFVVGLLYVLAQKGFLSVSSTRGAFSRWDLLGPAALVLFGNFFLGVLRWQWLLHAQGIHLPLLRTLQLTMIGNFFNIALPGAVSGDFVKAFYIGREIPGKRGRAFGSILFDRVAGVSALVLLSAGAAISGTLIGHDLLGTGAEADTMIRATKPLILGAAIGVIAFYAYLFLLRERHDPVLLVLKRLEARAEKFGSFVRIYEGLRHYHNHRWTVTKVLLISLFIHMVVGWACLQFASALGEGHLPLFSLYVIVPLGLLVTAIPVAPAGVGTGHVAFTFLFGLLGSQRGADVFTLFALTNLFFGGIGGLFYLRFRSTEAAPDPSI